MVTSMLGVSKDMIDTNPGEGGEPELFFCADFMHTCRERTCIHVLTSPELHVMSVT